MYVRSVTKIILIAAILLALLPASVSASPDSNYGSGYIPYTYNYQNETVSTPEAFEHIRTVNGHDVGGLPFSDISDITYDGGDKIYLADSGNNRILVTDKDLNIIKIISKYLYEGEVTSFNAPTSVACGSGKFYVSDSLNGRIVVFDAQNYELTNIFERPQIALLAENYSYQPQKIAIDYAGRIYVIAKNINQGLIQLDQKGEFMSFIGAPKVTPNFQTMLFRRFFPKTMREQLIKTVPTEYNSVNIDDKGFMFVTSQSSNIPPISRLNGQGTNVLKYTYNYPNGDSGYTDVSGTRMSSMFVDVIPRGDGGYFALEANYGRVFCYDSEGILLYIFGYIGSQKGSLYAPAAMEFIDGCIYIVDKGKENINVYESTWFGESVNEAMLLHAQGDYVNEQIAWTYVLDQCSNYDIASINLARIDIQAEDYSAAMTQLAPIGEKKYYNIAFKNYRSMQTRQNFYLIFALVVLVVLILVFMPRMVRKTTLYKRMSSRKTYSEIMYGTYVIFHPFDGFWDLKRERRGGIKAAVSLFAVFVICYALRARYTGYLFVDAPNEEINMLLELAKILLPLLLWIVANWCFTSLMNGEGTMKDIFIFTSYSLVPYIILTPILLVMSHFLTIEEGAFYTYLSIITVAWVLFLLFIGMMQTHDYSLGKTVLTTVLTIIGICLLVFIGLLFSNLVNEIFKYFNSIYREISYRFY